MMNQTPRSGRFSLALVFACLATLALPLSAPAQNLATRRLIDAAKTTDVPACEAAIKEKTGVAIPVEVDFASLGDGDSHFLSLKDLLQGITVGITGVAKDAAGKGAIAAKVKKIVLIRDEKGYDASFKDGTLTCKASFVSNFSDPMAEKIKAALEQAL